MAKALTWAFPSPSHTSSRSEVISFLNGLNGTLATVLICALLFADEAGVPLPLTPSEVLLLVAGLLIGTGTLVVWVFLPLALLAMSAGMVTGFAWAGAVGIGRLSSLAVRLHVTPALTRAMTRLRSADSLRIGITRLIPGVRTYATLVAGAVGVGQRRFLTGAIPALVVWLLAFTGVGALIGVPAERLVGQVDRYLISGALLLLLGLGAFLAVRHVPEVERNEVQLTVVPVGWRVLLALSVDLGIIASFITGIDRFVARAIHPGQPLGRVNDVIAVTALVAIPYVVVLRRIANATLGERLFDAQYGAVIPHLGRQRRRRRAYRPTSSSVERQAKRDQLGGEDDRTKAAPERIDTPADLHDRPHDQGDGGRG
jgi:membrane-associated protein